MGIGYKLFIKKNNKLHSLYVNATEEIPLLKWLPANSGQRTLQGKVKSKLGELAYRPGWHLQKEVPYVTHIYTIHNGIKYQKENSIWCIVEYADHIDYQDEANKIGINKQGNIVPKMAYLPYIPENGCYTYRTCPQMTGSWIISGAIKVIRELSNEEVARICREHGYEPLPMWKETAKNIG